MGQTKQKTLLHREPRFVRYIPPPRNAEGTKRDFHLIKELLHFKDGTTRPNIRFEVNYKRDYYVTKTGYRNHEQKKEWEHLGRLQKFSAREFELESKIAQTLDTFLPPQGRRALFRNPYIYGADISSTALLKYQLQKAFKGGNTGFSVAVFDTETDMIDGHEEVIMATLSFKDRVYTAVERRYLDGVENPKEKLFSLFNKELQDVIEQRGIKWELEIVDHRMDIIFNCFERAHRWQPDWVEIWNITFDIEKIIGMCDRYRIDPADIFSDPKIPKPYRYFYFRKGPVQRKTASGLVTPIKPAAQWHTVDCPASFQLVDGMQAYYHIRTGSPELRSYSMDAIMDREINMRKLRFEKGSHIRTNTADWHVWMQRHAKLEYVIYNVFDCVGLELLDEKVKDLSLGLPRHAKASDLKDFGSQPKRKATELHFFLLELTEPRVIGTTSDQMKVDLDEEIFPLSGWIVTLEAALTKENGLCVVKEHPNLPSRSYLGVADLDIKSSYPTNGACLNVSKETTRAEMISVSTLDKNNLIEIMNIVGGRVNALQVCEKIFNMPTPSDWLTLYDQQNV